MNQLLTVLPMQATRCALSRVFQITLLGVVYVTYGDMPTIELAGATSEIQTNSYVIYAGSTGTGVPRLARERMQQIEALLSVERVRINLQYSSNTVGLEGERRLCLMLPSGPDSRVLLNRLKALVADVPLLNLRAAPCPDEGAGF